MIYKYDKINDLTHLTFYLSSVYFTPIVSKPILAYRHLMYIHKIF